MVCRRSRTPVARERIRPGAVASADVTVVVASMYLRRLTSVVLDDAVLEHDRPSGEYRGCRAERDTHLTSLLNR